MGRVGARVVLLCAVVLLVAGSKVAAQGDELTISLRRDNGFGWGDQIQGDFTLSARGPADLAQVTFLIDGGEIGSASRSPYQISFSTDTFGVGPHVFSAVGRTADGRALSSNAISVQIVPREVTDRFLVAVVGVVLACLALVMLIPVLNARSRRRRPGESYGLAGGAICPKCGRPFALSLLGPNLLTRKLDRCPYCGRWSAVRPATSDELRAAEWQQGPPPGS